MKLPEKYRFTGRVMGDGASLGVSPKNNAFSGSYYLSVNVGGIGSTVSMFQANTGANVCVTTDPEKSGITLEKEPWMVFIAY